MRSATVVLVQPMRASKMLTVPMISPRMPPPEVGVDLVVYLHQGGLAGAVGPRMTSAVLDVDVVEEVAWSGCDGRLEYGVTMAPGTVGVIGRRHPAGRWLRRPDLPAELFRRLPSRAGVAMLAARCAPRWIDEVVDAVRGDDPRHLVMDRRERRAAARRPSGGRSGPAGVALRRPGAGRAWAAPAFNVAALEVRRSSRRRWCPGGRADLWCWRAYRGLGAVVTSGRRFAPPDAGRA